MLGAWRELHRSAERTDRTRWAGRHHPALAGGITWPDRGECIDHLKLVRFFVGQDVGDDLLVVIVFPPTL